MSHKEEAERVIRMPMGGGTVMEAQTYALTHAVFALIEAQEAANEQARIANLIALASNNDAGQAADQATKTLCWQDPSTTLRPEIARALGIGGAE